MERKFQEMMYTFKYVERNGRAQGNSWSMRQTTVYHQRTTEGTDLWIILHPKTESVFQRRLERLFWDVQSTANVRLNPATVHLLLFSSYIENWRWYLSQLSETFIDAVSLNRILYTRWV